MTFQNTRHGILLVLLIISTNTFGQIFTLSNETVIFSFDTYDGKKVTLNKDTTNKYIIYRFGTRDKIEFEFPNKAKDSWSGFTYSFYLRGGGAQNEGMDLNYISFINNDFKYVIYETYFAIENKQEIGIKVINLKTDKTTSIKGNRKTMKGTLVDFRGNNLLEIGDELFD